MEPIPKLQQAVQLVGKDKLSFNETKEVFEPREHQILCEVEAVGLCFSDLKVLKQFSDHVRKSEIVSGINPEILSQVPSYVPNDSPTVPGHEVVVRVRQVGPKVENYKPGQRYLVQADYRWLKTASSNGAFGYNFEGGLQEYVLFDERVITSPNGESMLLEVSDELSGSAVALVEPWACVEDAYVSPERTTVAKGGRMLTAADARFESDVFAKYIEQWGRPAELLWAADSPVPELENLKVKKVSSLGEIAKGSCDDVVYFGSDAGRIEELFTKVGAKGLLNIVLCGGKIGRDITVKIGRVHYGSVRITGTTGNDPAESMKNVRQNGEIRPGDRINVIGAGGPMGMMHVIRNICQGIRGVRVYAGDLDDTRLEKLQAIAGPMSKENNVELLCYNPKSKDVEEEMDYAALMAPVPGLVSAAVKQAAKGGIINIFAGIPVNLDGQIDLDRYIEKQLYFIGTSGSTMDDMKRVLAKVESAQLNTNASVAAVCDLANASDGIRAVEKRAIAGKIVVYPACKELGLLELGELAEKLPEVAEKLEQGIWTAEAERKLLESCAKKI